MDKYIDKNKENEKEKKIAIIDDDEGVLFLTKKILTKSGFSVETYASYYEFEEKFSSSVLSQCFDLLISDVRMPEISGFDVVEKTMAKDHSAKILLMTTIIESDDASRAMELGAIDYIEKPLSNPSLFSGVVKKLLLI